MPYVRPRWKIEARETTHPPHVWTEMRKPSGQRHAYVEHSEAVAELAKLKKIQPHAVLRISAA